MEEEELATLPNHCPVCDSQLFVTRLECSSCHTEVNGAFALGQLASLREPHASLLEMFLRVRGNVKEMERELGLSYPTVRARLEEAFVAAGYGRAPERTVEDAMNPDDLGAHIRDRVEESLARMEKRLSHLGMSTARTAADDRDIATERSDILDRLERGEISATEAADLLRELKKRSRR